MDSSAGAYNSIIDWLKKMGGKGHVKTLGERRDELRNTVLLRYTGDKSFSLKIGDSFHNIRPGWTERITKDLGEAMAQQFPQHFQVGSR